MQLVVDAPMSHYTHFDIINEQNVVKTFEYRPTSYPTVQFEVPATTSIIS